MIATAMWTDGSRITLKLRLCADGFWPPGLAGHYTFMAHSVLDEKGQLVDITPLDLNTPREGLAFLRHLGTEEDFSAMKTPCSIVLYPPFSYDEWHDSQLQVLEDTTNP
jgi:hypothetical protein